MPGRLDCPGKNVPRVLDLPALELQVFGDFPRVSCSHRVPFLIWSWPQDFIFNPGGFPGKITNLILIEINKQETGKTLFTL